MPDDKIVYSYRDLKEGERRPTMKEAVDKKQIRYYGVNKIDKIQLDKLLGKTKVKVFTYAEAIGKLRAIETKYKKLKARYDTAKKIQDEAKIKKYYDKIVELIIEDKKLRPIVIKLQEKHDEEMEEEKERRLDEQEEKRLAKLAKEEAKEEAKAKREEQKEKAKKKTIKNEQSIDNESKYFFTDILEIGRISEQANDYENEPWTREYYTKLFEELNKIVTIQYVKKLMNSISDDKLQNILEKTRTFYDKKKGIEYGDFVRKVIFPFVKSESPKLNNFERMVMSNKIASDSFFSSKTSKPDMESILRGFMPLQEFKKIIPNYNVLTKKSIDFQSYKK